jgi:hypothetical protein
MYPAHSRTKRRLWDLRGESRPRSMDMTRSPDQKLSRRIPGGQTMDMHERQEDDGSQSEQRRSFEMSNWIQWLKKRVLLLEQIITRYDHSEESHQPIKTCECFGM